MKKIIILLLSVMAVFGLSSCSKKTDNKSADHANQIHYSRAQLRNMAQKMYNNGVKSGIAFQHDQKSNSYEFDKAEGVYQPDIEDLLKKVKKNTGNKSLTAEVINLGANASGFVTQLEKLNYVNAKVDLDALQAHAKNIGKFTSPLDMSKGNKLSSTWDETIQQMKESDSKEESSNNNPDGNNSSTNIDVNSSSWSNPRHDDSSSESSSSSSSISNVGITNSDIESAINDHYSGLNVRDVEGQFNKPYTAGIEMTVKDTPKYNTEAGFKEDAYHILLAVKDEIGLKNFQNISITFYMHGDAMVKSEFNQSALSQINSSDSNYFNIQNTATTWDASNFHSELDR